MFHSKWDGRVLSVYATSRGIAHTVFESPLSPVDWGVVSPKDRQINQKARDAVAKLIDRFFPDVLVIEDGAGKGSRRGQRVKRLYTSIETLAAANGIDLFRYSRAQMKQCFVENFGASNKQDIAHTIAILLPELDHKVPPVRKIWQSEHDRMGIFDAAALTYAFYRNDAAGMAEG